MRVLVIGGAGYIGSHTVVQLADAGHEPVIVDDFSNADRAVLDRLERILGRPVPCHELDASDADALDVAFADGPVDAVIHFAAKKAVGESVEQPLAYYGNNLGCTLAVADRMRAHGVDRLIFSSSATVYGEDSAPPMREDARTSATNPYGWTKVMCEQILRDVAAAPAGPKRVALLRYFNPVGAHESGLIGESPSGTPSNLMPYVAQVAAGQRPSLSVFGDDYDTPDGTCQRDYIHVVDLAAGHVAALRAITSRPPEARAWNLGTGRPTSVLEMVDAFGRAVGRAIPYEVAPRRPGDVAVSYADPSRAEEELGWRAELDVDAMCRDTWRWQSNNPNGYAGSSAG